MKKFIVLFFVLIVSGCAPDIYTPPARFNLLETPETMGVGEHSVGGTFGVSSDALFTTLTYRTGVADAVDLGADGNIAKVGDRDCSWTLNGRPKYCGSTASPQIDDVVYSGRLRAKWALAADYVSIFAGFGGGHNTSAGSYVSPDVGMILAYPIGTFTPFVGGSVFVSQPFNTRLVDVSHGDDPPGTQFDEAVPTWGWYVNSGFSYRVPPARTTANPRVKVDLKAGINLYRLSQIEDPIDGPDTIHGLGLQIGPEVIF